MSRAALVAQLGAELVEERQSEFRTLRGRVAFAQLENAPGEPPLLSISCPALRFSVEGSQLIASLNALDAAEAAHDAPPPESRVVAFRVLPSEPETLVVVNERRAA